MVSSTDFQQQAKDAIRASGGRITNQREIILNLLANTVEAIDAETLYHSAIKHDPNISLPTIYRTLNTLESAKIIRSHYTSSDHERKTYTVNKHDNKHVFHFTCRKCGRVSTFKSSLISQLRAELSATLNAEIATLCMCAGGLCADCQQEETV